MSTDYGKRGRRKCAFHNGNYGCTLTDESCRGVCDNFKFKGEITWLRTNLLHFGKVLRRLLIL
jgi:hypothetical protein